MTQIEQPTPEEICETVNRLLEQSERLRFMEGERIAKAIEFATGTLIDGSTPLGRAIRDMLRKRSGLSTAMIEWGLSTTLGQANIGNMIHAVRSVFKNTRYRAIPIRLVITILAGNVFTAGFRAAVIPLLASVPVLTKVSTKEDVLPRFFKLALDEVDPSIGEFYQVIRFAGGDIERQAALFKKAEVVALYSSDDTVNAIRKQIPATTRLVVHGHGLGAMYIPASAIRSVAEAAKIAERAALDIAAYDQRGCLSPHVVCVQRGGAIDAEQFAVVLAEKGLKPLSYSLPRGQVTHSALAQQMQWRGVAKVRGILHEYKEFATSYEADSTLRASPGYRNVGVYDSCDAYSLVEQLSIFGVHLKALGVAGKKANRKCTAQALRAPLAPRISDIGFMQQPPLDALADGESMLNGLIRWIEY